MNRILEILRKAINLDVSITINPKQASIIVNALERCEAKEPIGIQYFNDDKNIGYCPGCGVGCLSDMNYCSNCGQLLEWEE